MSLKMSGADMDKSNTSYSDQSERTLSRRATDSCGLWKWDLETGKVFYSSSWAQMLGYSEDEQDNPRRAWTAYVHPDDRHRLSQILRNCLSNKADTFTIALRLRHRDGHCIDTLCRAFRINREADNSPLFLVGNHTDITKISRAEGFNEKNGQILEMIAIGKPAEEIYNAIALMYEARHPGIRCSMLELKDNILLHGGAPSLPKAYCDAIHGLKIGPNIGSCGTSTFTGRRCLVENIETDPKWASIKHFALPHGMRSCWSEPIKSSSGQVLGAFGMYRNYPALPNREELADLISAARITGIVMERDQDQKRIRRLAYTDELTELASRAHFYQTLEELIKTSQRYKRRLALLFIDLDDFKNVNDSLGHDAGDQLLKKIAARLKGFGREVDFVARLGGDEFCIVVENIDDDYTSAHIAQRCIEAISQPVEVAARKLSPACSIGIAHYPEDGNNLSNLLKTADTALYAAKGNGKNQYAFYKPELTRRAEYRFQVEQSLRNAIERHELSLCFQPQVELESGKIVGIEALCRWHHKTLGDIPPIEFISTAERIGMIKPLTDWVMHTACDNAMRWQHAGLPPLKMSINISPSHFLDNDIATLVKRVISETGIEPSNLKLEVTESVIQTEQENLSIFVELKQLGVSLAIDDFGTGYSSFASLKHLQADCLKIDRYFIEDILVDKQTRLLVGSMIEMGRNLGHKIIAEGVETTEQLAMLREMGCEKAQGYLFSKPVPADEITSLLQAAQH